MMPSVSKLVRPALCRIPTMVRYASNYAGRRITPKTSLSRSSEKLSTESLTQKMNKLSLNSASNEGTKTSATKSKLSSTKKFAIGVASLGLASALAATTVLKDDEPTVIKKLVEKVNARMNAYYWSTFPYMGFEYEGPDQRADGGKCLKEIERDLIALDALAKKNGKKVMDYFPKEGVLDYTHVFLEHAAGDVRSNTDFNEIL